MRRKRLSTTDARRRPSDAAAIPACTGGAQRAGGRRYNAGTPIRICGSGRTRRGDLLTSGMVAVLVVHLLAVNLASAGPFVGLGLFWESFGRGADRAYATGPAGG